LYACLGGLSSILNENLPPATRYEGSLAAGDCPQIALDERRQHRLLPKNLGLGCAICSPHSSTLERLGEPLTFLDEFIGRGGIEFEHFDGITSFAPMSIANSAASRPNKFPARSVPRHAR
jgi:hypothetical protein